MAHNKPLQPEFVSFKALYDYVPQEEEIELKVGDVCYVQKPISDPNGWLTGLNSRTKEHGRFPGTFCKILSNSTTIPLPPRPARISKTERPKFYPIKGHMIEKFHFVKPVWCNNCNYYIWGGDRVSLKCSGCNLSAHIGCVSIYHELECNPTIGYLPTPVADLTKVVDDWDTDDIIEWMAAVHLHPYMSHVKKNKVCGRDLKDVDETYLKSLGISIDLHIKLFKMCIEELLTPTPDQTKIRATEITFTGSDTIQTHTKLYEHTFTTLQNCDICNKSMFGIFRQGLMCAVCGAQCHPPCAYTSLPMCYGAYKHNRRPSDSEDPSFCCNFPSAFIPPVMLKCVTRIEESGLETANIYDADVAYYQCQALRSACNQNIDQVNIADNYWSDPTCAAFVLKSFLMELPDPLLDLNVYEQFLELSKTNYTLNDVSLLLRQQKDYNVCQLDYMISHFIRVMRNSDKNNMTLERLANIFSILLVRPPEHEARKFVTNWDLHEKVVHMILMSASTNHNEVVQTISRSKSDASRIDFNADISWLWVDGTKKDAQMRLSGQPDGSFLVRPSEERHGQYTLTVKESGKDRMIRIIQENDRCGFSRDNLQFLNLHELIEYFQAHSLKDYNQNLNTRLIYPCARIEEAMTFSGDVDQIKELYEIVDLKLKQIKLLEFEKEDKLNLLEECKLMSESQTDIVRFLEEQISLAEQQHYEASMNDRPDIQSSLSSLNDLLSQEKNLWTELDDQLLSIKHECNVLNTKLTELSPEVPILEEEYNRLHQEIKHFDKKRAEDSEKEDWKGIYDDPSALRNEKRSYLATQYSTEDMENLEEKDWIFGYLDKPLIRDMLSNKPNGTFLVRKSHNHPYVISLVYENSIKHVPILKGPTGYGFAEPHNVYTTLHALINHYHNQSLRMHNSDLDTTLKTPYKFFEQIENEPIYS